MKNIKLIFLFLSTVFLSYADYNTGLEFQFQSANNFNNFSLQYNSNRNDTEAWNNLPKYNEELLGGDLFWASGLKFNDAQTSCYLRLINTNDGKVSDIHSFKANLKTTVFFKMRIADGPALENIPEETPIRTKSLYYYNMVFRLKDLIIYSNVPDLLAPINNFITCAKSVLFSWNCPKNYASNNCQSYLIIGKGLDELRKIDVSGTNIYEWSESSANLEYGKYWWQIIVESNNVVVVGSEVRFFGLVEDENNIDSDFDGYTDNEEMTRGSNPNDCKDIPLIINSNENWPAGYIGLQYINILKANDNRYPILWEIIGNLPEGLVQDNNVISGFPRQTGDYYFRLRISNQKDRFDEKRMHIKIQDPEKSMMELGKGGYEDNH